MCHYAHPESLLQREVGKEDVRLQDVADLPFESLVDPLPVERDGATAGGHVAGQGVEEGGLARPWEEDRRGL